MQVMRNPLELATCLLLLVLAAGCGRPERIERYTVQKPLPVKTPPSAQASPEQPSGEPTHRTLAAIVPHGDQGWFFKLTGPKDPVAAHDGAFAAFLKSVRFGADGKPEWKLPAGWQQRPGSDIRYATLTIPSDGAPLEVSVTALPKASGDDENYALVNINRWRDQLKLPPITLEQLASESTEVPLDGATATMVNLVGTASPAAMGRPPFFPGTGNGK
jgi:hypothetical protein